MIYLTAALAFALGVIIGATAMFLLMSYLMSGTVHEVIKNLKRDGKLPDAWPK